MAKKKFTPSNWQKHHGRIIAAAGLIRHLRITPSFVMVRRSLCCRNKARLRVGFREWCIDRREAEDLRERLSSMFPKIAKKKQ